MMRTRTFVVVVAACLLACASGVAADLVGTWIAPDPNQYVLPGQPPVKYPNRNSSTQRIVFTRKDGNLTGTFVSQYGGEDSLSDIKLQGTSISFAEGRNRFRGMIQGNELQLNGIDKYDPSLPLTSAVSWHGVSKSRPYTFRRATAADLKTIQEGPIYSFEKLPLPALRSVSGENLAPTPPMGVGNFVEANDAEVRKVADEMVSSGLRDAGYVYLQIDEGWQGRRDAEGSIHPNDRFPNMKGLVDYVHSKGLKFGIYSSPGPEACYGYAGSYGHEEQDAKTFAAWGVDYLKYDTCSARQIYHTQSEMQALYQKMGEALRSSGHPVMYGLSSGFLMRFNVTTWGKNVGANLWRTEGDLQDSWDSLVLYGFEGNGKLDHAGPDGWNDPDALQVGFGGMTTNEYRTQMTLWSMMASPLFIQMNENFVVKWSPEIKAILMNREVISVDQDSLGNQGHPIWKDGAIEVWSKDLSDGSVAVAVFNLGNELKQVNIPWEKIQLKSVKSVRDLWSKQDLRSIIDNYQGSIPAHGSALLKVMAAK
jgi:alpha-galactosidase